jgi:HEAT repeat protein
MVERGLLTTRSNTLIGFTHPVIAGYFAGNAIAKRSNGSQVIDQPNWIGKNLALRYSAVMSDATPLVKKLTRHKEDLLQEGLLTVARWPRETNEETPWRIEVLRRLAQALQNDQLPLGIRARVTSALINTADDGIAVLFRQMVTSPDSRVRQLIAMGLGVLKDPKSIMNLNDMLDDPSPAVQRAACLGLVANGSLKAIEAVAYALLHHASEETRRAAAEALANHPSEGHPILKEGSSEKDLMVRRAVVYGLGRINEEWSKEILLKLQLEDEQWVVRSAAGEVLDNLVTDPHIPKRLPPLSESSWLIQFASTHGKGVPKGQGAWDMIYKALREGKEDDNIAAMEYLRQYPERAVEVIPDIYKHFYAAKGDLQEAALNTLWHLVAAGIELPSPQQFGYS